MNKITMLQNATRIRYYNGMKERREQIIDSFTKAAEFFGFDQSDVVIERKHKLVCKPIGRFVILPVDLDITTNAFELRYKDLLIPTETGKLGVMLVDLQVVDERTLKTPHGVIEILE